MSKVRVAVIGAGSISNVHLTAYAANPNVELVAICDLNGERAKGKAEQYKASRTFTDYKELLADPNIDAVSICTWNKTHAEISIAALEAGKHVLCEKPLCKTVEEALKVQDAVRRTGKLLQVGYVRRFGQNVQTLRKFIDAGELGDIYYAKASCLRRLGNPGGWFADGERSGGGPLIDLGVHIIDLCWYLMGKPKVKSVSGNSYRKLGNRKHIDNLAFYKAADYDADKNDVEDLANALIRFENGASLFVDVSFTLHAKKDELTVKIYGENGGAEIEPELQIITEKHQTILNVTPQIDQPSFEFQQAFQAEINHFIDCCQGNAELLSPVEDGVEMLKILSGIYQSAAEGKEVEW
ncbi:Gfo/Idh/MocA family protein [Paenibacillus radicis (ex Xue et al. 2023)]|uniref:Gfo/Idh/MocA family oxidoreductase n=1 Tax=Paenibacillus radicis (ex Xue et al. 2023) TaxID=2972489 RepID=A0ABT1YSF7_9BACL|nr:Gfo/Idh/MocA family oxidoreductase [Paenibacillus radicis (ex Xue et al. 2023)]MCR8635937.1 Gfo/Idh/MocA family oxidoreductase [Paenibacillus radicis (ex Xue et al. 2023)]